MWQLKEFVPEAIKDYIRIVAAKLRYPDAYIGSSLIAPGVRIGKHCSISRGVELASGVSIGDASYVNCGAIIGSGCIGRYCSIGPHSMIGLAKHPLDHLSTSPMTYGRRNLFGLPSEWNDFPDPPVIGNDVWIGSAVFIAQGVRIGDGAVIGAGSVVTRDVPPYGIAAGVPARLLRYRFPSEQVEHLLNWRWWDRSIDELATHAGKFQRPWAGEAIGSQACPAEEVASA